MGKNRDLKQRVRRQATPAELERKRLQREAVQAERELALRRQHHSERLQAVHRMFNMPRDSREAGPGGRGGGEEDVGGDDDEFRGLSEQPYDDQHEGDNDAEALEEGGVVGQQGEERLQQPSGSGEPATSGAKEQPADADEDGDADAEVLQDIASWAERDVGTEESFSESNDYMQWEEAADHFLLDESDWNDAMGNDDDDDAGDDDDPAAGTPAPAPEAEKV